MTSKLRLVIAACFVAAVFGILTFRVANLQLASGDDFYTLSQRNRLRRIPVRAPRGRIYDRNGDVLACSEPSYAMLWMLPTAEAVPEPALERAASYLGTDAGALAATIEANREFPYEPSEIAVGLTREQIFAFEEVRADYPELTVASRPTRCYPNGALACHLLGYVGEIGPARLAALKPRGYKLGDTVGLAGLEYSCEEYLRGRDGYETVEVNALEKKLGLEYAEEIAPPRAGCDLHLTLELGLQRLVESLLSGRRGAVIVMDPNSGDVWALASSPGVDPNDFAGGISAARWAAYANAPDHPLLNRAIQCSYPPGSTFKLVTATAALEEGIVKTDERMPQPCGGVFRYGRWLFHCWKRSGHGPLDIAGGLKNSCNVFFFQLGLRVGIDNLNKYARLYGYGSPTGIPVPHENRGLIPSRERLERKWGKRWPRGEVLNNAIGQGQVLLTPIQELVAFCAFANGGRLFNPRLVTHAVDAGGNVCATFPPRTHGAVVLKPETRATMLRGLIGVVNRYGVNAHYLAGKTGSAENPFGDTHAWFTGFAPAYEPRVAVCILVENGGYGESYIKWAKEIVGYCRQNVIGEAAWPEPPAGAAPADMEKAEAEAPSEVAG
ncbi:MAG TPA: penicillin-binding protein 2 [bacterium]|nr:penicillin-binding protein 2 [bacterium]